MMSLVIFLHTRNHEKIQVCFTSENTFISENTIQEVNFSLVITFNGVHQTEIKKQQQMDLHPI